MKALGAVQAEAIEKAAKAAQSGENPKYPWMRSGYEEHTAVAWNGEDEVGRVAMVTDSFKPRQRWMWVVTARLAPNFRSDVVCKGWAGTSVEAAAAAEVTYDILMEANWENAGHA